MASNLQNKSPLTREFPLEFLQSITNNFSEDRIIGEGGFAVVYKGVLDNGEEIALKKLTHTGTEDTKFADEFNNIVRARHQNIVQYVGYCYHPGRWIEHNQQYVFGHEPTRILCFEYLHGGDLGRHLSAEEQPCGLDWQTCYKIIRGVCAGLKYLHSVDIYHLDLKPANILLDNNMMPKIGDFGISRVLPSSKTITTKPGTLIGTMGFMPPEYIDKQEISSKYDMFSLGAILIQIMAGRKNYCDCGSVPSENFIDLVCEIWRKKVHPAMWSHTWKEVKACIRIALRCLEYDRHKRPTIREVVDELNRIDIEDIVDELDRIDIDISSVRDEAINLQSRVALAYNHYKNSASIGAHASSSQLNFALNPMDYEHESVMRNPESHAIGGHADVLQTNQGHRFQNQNLSCSGFIREEGSVHTLVTKDRMDITGVTSDNNEYVNLFQWARSAISSKWRGTEEKGFQNKLLHLGRGLQRLSDTLPEKYDLINRVEWRNHKDGVVGLLPKLKDVVYDVEDLLDELRWYNHKVIVEGNASQSSIIDFFNSFINLNDIHERLDYISNILEKMGLGELTPRFDKTVRPETSSFPNETKIFGRGMELEQILGLLVPKHSNTRLKHKRETSADESIPNLMVLPIVGIGGVGKTTLAQHICSHPQVKSHFNPIIWICVSDDFDVKRLTKEVIESNPGKVATSDNLNSLQNALSKILHNKRFLIVLDDMWDDALKENGQCWKRFCAPLQDVLQGSMILVTTRSPKVAGLVAKSMEPIILEGLDDGVFWNFFKLCAFGSESSDDFPELELIGRKIVPKLKGSPLAAKTLGRMLQDDLRTSHWNCILDNELWELDQETTEILPALRLSYMYLPFHLKRCFSFCAVYPKDREFERDYLAEIWAAEGFVKCQGVVPLQHIGCQYFNDLLNRSFFQEVQGKYLIHDLLHDMAQKVSEDDCFIVKRTVDFKRVPQNVRHLSVLTGKDIYKSDLSSLSQYKKLRTLICNKPLGNKKTPARLVEDWCNELLRMRVIVCASLNELPASIGKLKHLRYLEISRSCYVTSFPTAFCRLHNLQVLCVKKCQVESLPSDFNRLINLWRFESQGFKYGPNIRGFPEEYYGVNIDVAEDKFGLGCRFIKNVKQLRGHLVINNVYKLSKYHSADANLKNKDCFDKVTLQWGKWSTKFSDENKIEVLADLQPPASTKSLVLEGYPGVSRPSWFEPQSLPSLTSVSFLHCDRLRNRILNGSTGFSSLTDLIIDGCYRLSSLKQLLHPTYLPVIKRIALMNCRYLVSVPTERFGDFRCLEIFKLLNCGKINSASLTAPSLKKLMLDGSCGNLTDNIQCCSLTNFFLTDGTSIQLQMWNLPALQELHIKGGSLTSIGQSGHVFTNLTSLTISWCDKLSTIDGLLEKEYLPAIESITFADCMSLSMHGERFGDFSSLKDLKVSSCHKINWAGLVLPSSLQSLHLYSCGDISSFITSGLENLQSLVSLKLSWCSHIRSIPGHLWSSTLSSLQELQIHFCWDLVSIGGADDISEIQNVWIEDCRNLKGIEQPLKRGSFFIAKKKEQPVKTSSKSVWCMPTGD
ncbi:hypothetical protein CFC21_080934 [Triticum aestivum]|uniref:Protein kinase domain-containing protein n=2 Tax=Triticum aestivum TaxID=4565 RepID=A0A3B6N2C4_WHEAT|nr:putative disease resistance protein RGA4 isoform X3 [Triticum aestivum]KAF7076250.1 hypothetical protein CFC21_080934 [Triticum aestivum]